MCVFYIIYNRLLNSNIKGNIEVNMIDAMGVLSLEPDIFLNDEFKKEKRAAGGVFHYLKV